MAKLLYALVVCLAFQFTESFRIPSPLTKYATKLQSQCKLAYRQSVAPYSTSPSSRLFSTAVEQPAVVSSPGETFAFESNVARVMDIIINSLYSNKDVFIRELVSNAADACDKKRFMKSASNEAGDELKIRVYPNRSANTLTIEDSGVGMNKEDLIKNLGRIAESGTKLFLDNVDLKNRGDVNLIGQFGVGFYSGFLVSDKITVISKGSEGKTLKWEASASSLDRYTISEAAPSEEISGESGTRIILHLKEESDQYLDDVALKSLIGKYSEFVGFPIELEVSVTKPEQIPDPDALPDVNGTVPMKTNMKKVLEWQVVNTKKPLWLRNPKTCNENDYEEFYRQTFQAYDKPAAYSHFSVEGNVDFKALLYLPSEVPFELSRDMFASSARSLRLYVKRVFINDKFEDLIPRWLLFVRGVVDSDDLPLNVGREILQQSRSLRIIRQRLAKKAIDMIADLSATNTTGYTKFWKNFGKYLKVGVIEDEKSRSELVPLLRFFSTQTDSENSHQTVNMTSIPEYVSRMPIDQRYIYYSVGETKEQAAMTPSLEALKKKGYEVLLVSEAIDEMTLQSIDKFDGRTILDVGREAKKDMTEDEKREKQEKNDKSEDLRLWIQKHLGSKIKRVEASTRLVDSPAAIVQSEYGVSPNMQKFLRAQQANEDLAQGKFENIFNQAVLEINMSHSIIQRLQSIQQKFPDSVASSEEAKEIVDLLFATAALSAGYSLDNNVEYSKMVIKMLTRAANPTNP